MDNLLELLKYILPALVVFGTAYFLIKQMLDRDERRQKLDILMKNQKIITPIRLQAYERIILFLERISPESMIKRVLQPQMKAKQMQMAMLATIRSEFEHNLSQQIYVSSEAWETVLNAKENIIQLINVVGNRASSEDTALTMSKTILDMLMKVEEPPLKKAINFVKQESSEFFGIKREYE